MSNTTQVVRDLVFAIKVDNFSELGDLIGASDKNIYKWVEGKSTPDSNHLLALIAVASNYTDVTKIITGQQ